MTAIQASTAVPRSFIARQPDQEAEGKVGDDKQAIYQMVMESGSAGEPVALKAMLEFGGKDDPPFQPFLDDGCVTASCKEKMGQGCVALVASVVGEKPIRDSHQGVLPQIAVGTGSASTLRRWLRGDEQGPIGVNVQFIGPFQLALAQLMIVVAWLQWNLLPKVVQDLFQLERSFRRRFTRRRS